MSENSEHHAITSPDTADASVSDRDPDHRNDLDDRTASSGGGEHAIEVGSAPEDPAADADIDLDQIAQSFNDIESALRRLDEGTYLDSP